MRVDGLVVSVPAFGTLADRIIELAHLFQPLALPFPRLALPFPWLALPFARLANPFPWLAETMNAPVW